MRRPSTFNRSTIGQSYSIARRLRLAMSVFQRRLASSTYALMRSFERRIAKLDGLIADVEDGKLTMDAAHAASNSRSPRRATCWTR